MFESPEGYIIDKLKPSDREGIVEVALKLYTKGEPLGDLIGLSYNDFKEFMEPLILDWLKYDYCMVAKCEKTDEIAGLLLSQPLVKGEDLLIWGKFSPQSSKAKYYTEVCTIIESAVNVLDLFGVDKALDHSYLAVREDHRHKGLGIALAKAVNKIGEEDGFRAFAVTATNKYTAQIYRKLGFSSVYRLDYNTLEYNGKMLDPSVTNGTEAVEVLGLRV
ncbi:Dopamine N-acetyltransferase [Armadillidium vulgare]|nr:Dopamine N-acetyltransferase [Armadillidium vulgare]